MLRRLDTFLLEWGRRDLSDAINALNTQAMNEFRGATHPSKTPQRQPMPAHSNVAYDSNNGGRSYLPYRRTRSTPNHGFPPSPHTMTSPHKVPTNNYRANAAIYDGYDHNRNRFDFSGYQNDNVPTTW